MNDEKIDIYGSNISLRSDPQAFAAYASAVMAAARYNANGSVDNVDFEDTYLSPAKWAPVLNPAWSWNDTNYRISPSTRPKRFVTWRGPEDVPKGPAVWLMRCVNNDFRVVTGIYPDHVTVENNRFIRYEDFIHYRWSPDRVVWAPCEVEVEG